MTATAEIDLAVTRTAQNEVRMEALVATDAARPAARKSKQPGPKTDLSAATDANAMVIRMLLERLLAMAQRYRHDGAIREAMELYWEIAEEYPQTPEAAMSRAVLLDLAVSFERHAAPHMARSIYERLLADGTG
jgi:hypothetical protein